MVNLLLRVYLPHDLKTIEVSYITQHLVFEVVHQGIEILVWT